MNILIVEDEMIISEDIAMTLESHGYQISGQAVDYDDALASIASTWPDLVLLDINLQGQKDGIDVAEAINKKGKIPLIYTSSLSNESTIARAKKTSPAAYLIKPFRDEQLLAAIEVAMANFQKEAKADTVQHMDPSIEESLPLFNDAIFVKDGHKYVKVRLEDIRYAKKSDNYLDIFTEKDRYIIRSSMDAFISKLGSGILFRTHKSYAVNLNFMTDIAPNILHIGPIEIPLSKSYADLLKSKLNLF